jgi:hypothetical protein
MPITAAQPEHTYSYDEVRAGTDEVKQFLADVRANVEAIYPIEGMSNDDIFDIAASLL